MWPGVSMPDTDNIARAITPETAWLLEQLGALSGEDSVIHEYRCVSCQMASAAVPLIIADETGDDLHVTVIGLCEVCANES